MEKVFDELSISLATSDQMRTWSFGEVKKPETINYRTLKPEKEGLFDERIFGPTKDWECSCGRYKRIRYRGIVCERCGVEVTRREVRRERMGHIELAAPVTHIWYFKGVPSRLGYFLDMSPKELEKIIYFAAYLVVSVDTKKRAKDLSELEEAVDAEVEIVEEDFEDWEKKRVKQMVLELKAMKDAKVPQAEIDARETEIKKEIKQKKAKSDAEIEVILEAFDELKTLKPKTLIENDTLWREMTDKYDEYFKGGMGAEAVRDLVLEVNVKSEMKKLRLDLTASSAQKKQRAIQRMKVIKPFADGKNPPEAMILEVIPVIPPELRPMVQLDGGRFATSDLNDLYRRLINRNNRLKKLLELGAPEIIISNEKRMLQESVDALFDNGRRGRAVAGAGGRGLKSLSDMLKGKQGRFRQNLLGKRVDYSARSVIVVGPHLELQQCGLPKMMALELFKPFVMKRLVDLQLAQNIKSAKRMVERARAQVWDVLADVIEEHPVLLNRAPTLHRLGIQAFEPILVEGKAIQVHPLVCEAFNADFDGDQMAVHVPLSAEAQAEAKVLMLSTNNVLSPSSGNPIVSPSQDMVIGLYYITECYEDWEDPILSKDFPSFVDVHEAQLAYESGHIGLHTPINIRLGELSGDKNLHKQLKKRFSTLLTEKPINGDELIVTTLGRVYFNSIMPKDFPYIQPIGNPHKHEKKIQELNGKLPLKNEAANRKVLSEIKELQLKIKVEPTAIKKPEMQKIINEVIQRYNKAEVRDFLDAMKTVGFKFGTKSGLTIAMTDIKIPEDKKDLLDVAEDDIIKLNKRFFAGDITPAELAKEKQSIWNKATNAMQGKLIEALEKEEFNPLYMMVKSGARGNVMQVRQLGGMRGLVTNTKNEMIETPIKTNFREGMSVLDYFSSTHGARKGLADTALRTADSGYLTRRLVDVAAGIVIKDSGEDNIDWNGTRKKVIEVDKRTKKDQIVPHLHSSIYGRVLAQDVKVDNKQVVSDTGEKLTKGTFVNDDVLSAIITSGVREVFVLTPFNSRDPETMESLCYGYSLATGSPVEEGEAVGIIAAQSIGEPGTQLTMRNFHIGGQAQTEARLVPKVTSVRKELSKTKPYEVFNLNHNEKTKTWRMYCLEKTGKYPIMHKNYIEDGYNPDDDNSKDIEQKIKKTKEKISEKVKELKELKETSKQLKEEIDKIKQDLNEPKKQIRKFLKTNKTKAAKFISDFEKTDPQIQKEKAKKLSDEKKNVKQDYKKIMDDEAIESMSEYMQKFNVEIEELKKQQKETVKDTEEHTELKKRIETKKNSYENKIIENFKKQKPSEYEDREKIILGIDEKLKELDPKKLIVQNKDQEQKLKKDWPELFKALKDKRKLEENLSKIENAKIKKDEDKEKNPKEVDKLKDQIENLEFYLKNFASDKYKSICKLVEAKDDEDQDEFTPLFESQYTYVLNKKNKTKTTNKIKNSEEEEVKNKEITSAFDVQSGLQKFFERNDKFPKGHKNAGKKWLILREVQVNLTGTTESVTGLPRVVEIFEARSPKNPAVLSPISGKIAKNGIEVKPDGKKEVTIENDKESSVTVEVGRLQVIDVIEEEEVQAGQAITLGNKDPKEVLQINGVKTCQEHLVEEVQRTYREQGVEVHDKHVEMIIRQMLRRVRIVKTNDSDFLPNELVDSTLFRLTNQELVKKKKTPAEGRPELMGITKASLATDSWLSAASFQETTRVLTEAAMKNTVDNLTGLKENVIIGTLIPAGTGSQAYQKLSPSLPDAPQVSDLGFMEEPSENGEIAEDSLPNPAQWLAMLGEEGDEETE